MILGPSSQSWCLYNKDSSEAYANTTPALLKYDNFTQKRHLSQSKTFREMTYTSVVLWIVLSHELDLQSSSCEFECSRSATLLAHTSRFHSSARISFCIWKS